MQQDLQNAYSRQASLEVERQVGRLGTASVGYSYLRGQGLLMAINQNVPSCVAARHQQRLPAHPRLRQQQSVFLGGRVRLPRAARLAHAAPVVVGLLPCQLHALEVPEQRRGVLLQRTHRSLRPVEGLGPLGQRSPAPVRLLRRREHIDERPPPRRGRRSATDFQLSAMLQAYSAAPFNITSGVTTIQGTAGRPIVDGEYIPRNSGAGRRVPQPRPARQPVVPPGWPHGSRPWPRCSISPMPSTRSRATRTSEPAPTRPIPRPRYNQVTAVGDARSWQFGLRLRF